MNERSRLPQGAGFTLIELLLVIAVVAIIASISAATFVNWRADALHSEVTAFIGRVIVETREESRRQSLGLVLSVDPDDASLIQRATLDGGVEQRRWRLPAGAVLVPVGGAHEDIGFDGVVGAQDPYEVVLWRVQSGNGLLQRTSDVSVVPPVGLTAVQRR